ncbi:MAG TPA: hypothetical protein VGR35_19290 [Tepidisphaeraceae bacterium]|nr:hypothetical protein [Tepidisphaeraceae bacterium]
MATTTKTKMNRLNPKQRRLLADLEKCEKPVDVIFQDHRIKPKVLGRWLLSEPVMAALNEMRRRMKFRLEQELTRGAVVASARLFRGAMGGARGGAGDGFARTVEMQACVNTIKLFEAVVRSPRLKKQAATAMRLARETAGGSSGYHPSHTPQRAAALLARIRKEQDRENRLDHDQDENGDWVPAD